MDQKRDPRIHVFLPRIAMFDSRFISSPIRLGFKPSWYRVQDQFVLDSVVTFGLSRRLSTKAA